MKKILYAAIFFLSLTGGTAFAQQQPQFSHYAFNGMYLSPGYAGMNKATEFNLIGRYQWFNYNADFNDDGGSPKTGLFNVSIPVRKLHGGLGVNIAWDDIAATNISFGSLSYAYHATLGSGVLGIGAQGIVTNIEKGSGYRYIDPFDEKIPSNSNDTKADLGLGLWYQADKFYLGAGINNLLGSTYQFETEDVIDPNNGNVLNPNSKTSVTSQKHLYVSGGYNIDASSNLVVTPTALLKYDFDNKPSFDLGARGTFNETWWVGLNYRHQEAVSGLLGINLLKDKSMRVGYAFDFTTFGKEAKATGSHELMLSFRIPQSPLATKPAIRTPRYSF